MMQSLITALKCETEELKVGVKAANSDNRQQNLIHSLPTISNEVPNKSSFSKASAQCMEISKVVHDLNRRKCNVIVVIIQQTLYSSCILHPENQQFQMYHQVALL